MVALRDMTLRIGLSFLVESDCPVSLRQRLDDEELDDCVGAEDGLPRSRDGVDFSDCCESMLLCIGMEIDVEPSAVEVIPGVVETEVLTDMPAKGEEEGEVDNDETSGGEGDSSSKSEGTEGSTSTSLIA